MRQKKKLPLKFTQIVSAQWEGNHSLTYSIYGLTTEGEVFQHTTRGWKRLAMTEREEEGEE